MWGAVIGWLGVASFLTLVLWLFRVQVGSAHMALVYLLNREPQKAIDVLHDTQAVEGGRDLNAQRRRLEARSTEADFEIDERLRIAARQSADKGRFDHVILNDRVDRAVGELLEVMEREAESP